MHAIGHPEIAFRDVQPGDLEELYRIDQLCFAEGIAYSRYELSHYLKQRGAFGIAVERSGQIMAFIVANRRRSVGHIITIDVLPQARRMQLGSGLLNSAESRLRTEGCDSVYLEVAVDNAAAISFYKRHAYFVLSTLPRYYNGEVDALRMGKRLDSKTSD